ncbi:MAG: ABC transporter ATP-binding protein [Clostridia bacterium]|nr:ABC transporter ATP-binding protein [Clostridia bacterium]
MNDLAIKISHVSKEYRLGMIGGATLREELQSKFARLRGKEDPNLKIGQKAHTKNERFLALDDISLEIRKGERVGIIGHNGAGKSTLLKLICRVTTPTTGEICMNGRITSMLEVGTGFHGELTGRENVYLNGAILGLTKAEIAERFDKIVEFSEVGQFIDTPVKRYSSGMHVKLGFAVASHLDSEIMIMDEVLAVGDMAFQKKCIDRMRLAAEDEGRTILYVSHNMQTIRQLCSRCIVMEHGKIVFDGDPDKAIELYLPQTGEEQYMEKWEFAPNQISLHQPDAQFMLEKFQFAEKNGFDIPQGSDMHFFLQVRAKIDSDAMFFRIIYYDKEDSLLGMTDTSPEDFRLKEGENLFEGSCRTAVLAPGIYKLRLELCGYNRDGEEYLYASIDRIVHFHIVENKEFRNLRWHHSWWGECDFGKMTLRQLRSGKSFSS